jgi:hypothetical protein
MYPRKPSAAPHPTRMWPSGVLVISPVLTQLAKAFGTPLVCRRSVKYAGRLPIQTSAFESVEPPTSCPPPIT